MAPTATAPMVPIMPEPAAAGAVGAAGAAGAAAGVGALAAGAEGAAGALAGAMALGFALKPPPNRLAWASDGSVSEAMARTAMDKWVREEACMSVNSIQKIK